MKTVQQLIDELIGREGGYTNHPADKGGPTNYGITEHVARAYGYKGDMKVMPRETAVGIYYRQYWNEPGFDQVSLRMPKLGEELFDTGVNMGPSTAAKFLQRALNVLNQGTLDYPNLVVDGKLGRMTFYALDHFKTKRGANAETVLLRAVDAMQLMRYVDIAETNPSQEDFMFGWILNRVGGA